VRGRLVAHTQSVLPRRRPEIDETYDAPPAAASIAQAGRQERISVEELTRRDAKIFFQRRRVT
jgi:hypothetical protein